MKLNWSNMERIQLAAIWTFNLFAWISTAEEFLKIISLALAIMLTLGQMVIHRKKFITEFKELFKNLFGKKKHD